MTESPTEKYDNLVAKGHRAIDTVFATDHSEYFTQSNKLNNSKENFSIGIIPLPGIGSNADIKDFSNLGKAADRAGFTKAGRSLMKHGYREDSVFPKPTGNRIQINQHGQEVLESILNHPDKQIIKYTHKRYGPVIDIEAPKIGGVRFNGDGTEMMGFLEPHVFMSKP